MVLIKFQERNWFPMLLILLWFAHEEETRLIAIFTENYTEFQNYNTEKSHLYFQIQNLPFIVKLNAYCTADSATCQINQKYTVESHLYGQ